jgi:hypothetical protein
MRRSTTTPVAILVAVFVILVLAVVIAGPAPSTDQDPSSTAGGKAGTLALYGWLQAIGDNVQRIDSEFDLAGNDVLISAAPLDEYAYTAGDDVTLTSFLDGGGEVILAIGNGISDPTALEAVLQPLSIDAEPSDLTSAAPSQPYPGSGGVGSVPLVPPGVSASGSVWSFSGDDGQLVPLLGSADAPVAVAVQVGAGRLYLLGSEYPLSNDGLRRGDSAAFVLGLLQGARGHRVGFDEVHHLGAAGSSDQGLTAVFQGPLLAAAVAVVVIVLLFLWTSGRRLGRPLPRRDPGRVPSVLEHIDAVGHLLSRTHERGAVAGRYAEELKLRVGRATGVEPRLSDTDFVAALSGFGEARAHAAGVLLGEARVMAGGRPSEGELLGLARRVDALESEWGVAAIR